MRRAYEGHGGSGRRRIRGTTHRTTGNGNVGNGGITVDRTPGDDGR